MIGKDGHIYCDYCGSRHESIKMTGYLEYYCRKCKRFNKVESKSYKSHKLLALKNDL